MAADAHGAFLGAAGPHRLEEDADGGEDGNVKDGDEAFREIFGVLHFEGDAAKAEIQDAGAT